MYLSGIPHGKVASSEIIDKVVKLVEETIKDKKLSMVPINKVRDIINKYETLEKEFSSGNIDSKLFAKKSKEYANLGNIINIAKFFVNFDSEKQDLLNLIQDKSNDKEIIDLAEKDLNELIKKKMIVKIN